ncbi:MAG: type II CRISPR-associated endonuclease Cas1 [Alphaproteobacteria bacterium]
MIGRVVEIAEDGRHLSLHRGFMVVSAEGGEVGRVPLDDVAVLLANGHGLSYSNNLLLALAERGASVVLCGRNRHPAAWLWPLAGNYEQSGRMLAQSEAPRPLMKRLWQALVVAKIHNQAAVLDLVGKPGAGVRALASRVRSGDPRNLEAQAARRYWPLLMGPEFRRERKEPGINALLNYGYTVLRAGVARAVAAAGLHPSLGIHHVTRTDPLILAADLMEPFRPLVDLAVVRLAGGEEPALDRDAKAALAGVLLADMQTARGTTPLITCLERLAYSLAMAYENRQPVLDLPLAPLPLDAASLGRAR